MLSICIKFISKFNFEKLNQMLKYLKIILQNILNYNYYKLAFLKNVKNSMF